MEAEQILQERLERLETGETLENILAGLPEEESDLLHLAAQIRAIPKPVRNAAFVREQHQKVVQAARQNRSSSAYPFSLKWLIPVGVLLILFAAVAGIFTGIAWLSNRGTSTPDPIMSSDSGVDKATQTKPAPGETPPAGQFPTPIISSSPEIASLQSIHGIVQVQQSDGSWITVQTAELKAGETFRTWTLSSAQLVFFDGSMVSLGSNTRVTIETLNALSEDPRQIGLFQPYGETSHNVAPSTVQGSSYVVRTPSGTGEAKGAAFQVTVNADKSSSFAAIEGEVVVTGQQTMLTLTSGQITFVEQGADPSAPVFWIDEQGEVTQTGEAWIIGGVEFQTHEATVITGNPQVGDWVSVRGRLLADGTRLADHIEMQAPAFVNRFRITGVVEEMGSSNWTVSEQVIVVNEETQIDEGIEIGSRVLVRGIVQEGGRLLATHIQLLDENTRFDFTGLVEQIERQVWTISGVSITTNPATEITGDPAVGDLVHVVGQVLPDGTWLAHKIEEISETNRFEFSGTVDAMDPWLISGIPIAVNELTQISSGIEIGSRVRVEGVILETGTWLASEIQLLDGDLGTLVFVGVVESTDPWVVNGIPLNVTEDTVIIGDITLRSWVRVYVRILDDGTWLVMRIELIETGPAARCIEFTDMVVSFDSDEIILQGGFVIPRRVAEIFGELEVRSRVLVKLCFSPEREIIYASIIVVGEPGDPRPTPTPEPTSEPPPEPTSEPPPEPTSEPPPEPSSEPPPEPTSEPPPEPTSEPPPEPTPVPTPGDKVTLCHIPPGNPDNAKTITVDSSAVDAHLAHGDYLGPCQGDEDDGKDHKDDTKDDDDEDYD